MAALPSLDAPLPFQFRPFNNVATNLWLQQFSISPSCDPVSQFLALNQARNGWNLDCNPLEVKDNREKKNADCAFSKSKHGKAQRRLTDKVRILEQSSSACNQAPTWTRDLCVKPQNSLPAIECPVNIFNTPQCRLEGKVLKLEQSSSEPCFQAPTLVKDKLGEPQTERPAIEVPVKIIDSPGWLPPGWITEVRTRATGTTAGTRNKYYKDPISGHRFRSRNEVNQFLQTGRFSRYRPKHLRGNIDASADASTSNAGALYIFKSCLAAASSTNLEVGGVNPQVSQCDTHSKAADLGFVPLFSPCISKEIVQVSDSLNKILPERNSQMQDHLRFQALGEPVKEQAPCGDEQAQDKVLQKNLTSSFLEQSFKDSSNKVNILQAGENSVYGASMAHKAKSFCTNQMDIRNMKRMKLKQEKDSLVILGRKLCLQHLGLLRFQLV